jgi:predicted amidohydrolase YtcJ
VITYTNAYLWQNNRFTPQPGSITVHDGKIVSIQSMPELTSETHSHTPEHPHANTPTRQHANTLTLPHANTPTHPHFHTPTRQHANTPTRPHSSTLIDLGGAYLYPGFIDTHTHSFEGGLYSLGLDLSAATCISEVLEQLAEINTHTTKGEIIFAWQLDETMLKENRFPTLAELDKAVPAKALVLRRVDGHSCMLNSFARAMVLNLDSTEEVLRGFHNDQAVHFFHRKTSPEMVLKAYHAAAEIALKGGFTGIHTMIGDAADSIGHYALIRDCLESFAVDFTIYPQSFNLKVALDAGAKRIGGCILADGSIGSFTAALGAPYLNSEVSGILYQSDNFWQDFISKAHTHNLQVAVHCIGDRAIRQINNVYKHLAETNAKDLRHQLIHCEITDDALVQEIKASGAVPVMQPNFDLLWGGDTGFYTQKLGLQRSRMMNRFGSLTHQGVCITGGSDWYITPLNAPLSISAAINHHNPSERLSPAEAVDIYTTNAAWLSGDEQRTGAIKEGYQANFTLLSHPLGEKDTSIPTVLKTIYRGEISYAAK